MPEGMLSAAPPARHLALAPPGPKVALPDTLSAMDCNSATQSPRVGRQPRHRCRHRERLRRRGPGACRGQAHWGLAELPASPRLSRHAIDLTLPGAVPRPPARHQRAHRPPSSVPWPPRGGRLAKPPGRTPGTPSILAAVGHRDCLPWLRGSDAASIVYVGSRTQPGAGAGLRGLRRKQGRHGPCHEEPLGGGCCLACA